MDTQNFGEYSDWAKENLAKGVSPDTIQQTLSQIQQPKQSGDFWSTVGGIAAPIIGGLLAPETGGASLLAGMALSGLGGAGGKAIDNAVAGQDPFQANDIGAGVLNAAGAGAGGLIGKGIGAVLPKAAGMAGSSADKLLMGQAPKGMLEKPVANTLRENFGVSNLEKATPTIEALTGSAEKPVGSALSKGVMRGLQGAADTGQVSDLSGLNTVARNLVSENQTLLKPNDINNINRILEGAHINAVNPEDITQVAMSKGNGVLNIPGNSALKNVLPEDAFKVAKNFETLAQKSMNAARDKMGNIISPDQEAKAKIFQGLAQHAEEQAFGGNTPLPLSLENKAQIIKDISGLKATNPTAYNHILNTLADEKFTLNDLRSLQSPLVKASQALNASQRMENIRGGKSLGEVLPIGAGATGFTLGGPGGGLVGYAAGKALESKPAAELGTNVLGKLSKIMGKGNASKMSETLGKIAGVGAVNLPFMGASPSNQSTLSSLGTGENQGANTMQPNNTISDILQMMQEHPFVYGSQLGGVLSTLAPQLQQNQMAQNAISALGSEYQNAGGAQGLGGVGSVLSSLVPGTAANAYQGESEALAAELAPLLGIKDPNVLRNLMPGLLQSPETANQRLGVLQSLGSGLPT